MEVKKNPEVDGERVRFPLSMLGLLIIVSLVLASFSYRSPIEQQTKKEDKSKDAELPMETETKQEEEPPPPPPDVPEEPAQEPVLEEELPTKENVDEDPKPPISPPAVNLKAKEDPEPPAPPIVDFPDVEAEFPGGAAEMKRYLSENIDYPEIAIQMGDMGKVYVEFVVERDGSISNIKVLKGVSKELDREAKRVVRSFPAWKPGEKDGEAVRSPCRIPINFIIR